MADHWSSHVLSFFLQYLWSWLCSNWQGGCFTLFPWCLLLLWANGLQTHSVKVECILSRVYVVYEITHLCKNHWIKWNVLKMKASLTLIFKVFLYVSGFRQLNKNSFLTFISVMMDIFSSTCIHFLIIKKSLLTQL